MSVEAWDFLVSRNPYLDYRTIVAPDFICDAGIPNLLARAADGDLTEPGYAIYRKIEGSEIGDFAIVFRVIQALGKYINLEDGESFLKDSFGREIYLLEGVVVKRINEVLITEKDFEKVHLRVKLSYQEFWGCIDVPPVKSSSCFHLQVDESDGNSELLTLDRLQPLKVSSKKKVFHESTWKIQKKLDFGFRISSVAFSPIGEKIAIKSYNSFVEILNLNDYKRIVSIDRKLKNLIDFSKTLNFDFGETLNFDRDRAVSFSPDGNLIAFSAIQGSERNNILLWNIDLDREVNIFKGVMLRPFGRIHSIAFSRDGKLLASASHDSTVKFWDIDTGQQDASLQNQNPVYAISFSPNDYILASGGASDNVEFWDINDKRRLDILKAKEISPINSITFNSDGSMLAVGGDGESVDGKHVEIWNIETKKLIHFLAGHSDPVNSVAFHPDSQILASGSQDGSVKLWDVSSGKEIRTLSEQNNPYSRTKITSVAFSPDGKLLASSSDSGTVTIWSS